MVDLLNDKEIRVLTYVRVSTDLQETRMQNSSIKKFMEYHPNIKQIKRYEDYAKSGKYGTEQRVEFGKLMQNITKVDALLIYDWDRISRNEKFANSLMYELRDMSIPVIETLSGMVLDFDELHYRFMVFIKSAYAERERIRTQHKVKDGIEAIREERKEMGLISSAKDQNGEVKGQWGREPFWGSKKPKQKEKIAGRRDGQGSYRYIKDDWYSEAQFWKKYEEMREYGTSKAQIARNLHMSYSNLYKCLNSNKLKHTQIEARITEIHDKVKQLKKQRKKGHPCPKCDLSFKNESELLNHVLSLHTT